MLKLVSERQVWWPVTLSLPADQGEREEVLIELRFRILGVDATTAFLASADNTASEGEVSRGMAEMVQRFVVDWRGVGDEKGKALPFSVDALAQLMDVPGAFMATLKAYRECFGDLEGTRSGN